MIHLEHAQLQRFHGAEPTDALEAEGLVADLPQAVWTNGPFDVGFLHTEESLTFMVNSGPIWDP